MSIRTDDGREILFDEAAFVEPGTDPACAFCPHLRSEHSDDVLIGAWSCSLCRDACSTLWHSEGCDCRWHRQHAAGPRG